MPEAVIGTVEMAMSADGCLMTGSLALEIRRRGGGIEATAPCSCGGTGSATIVIAAL